MWLRKYDIVEITQGEDFDGNSLVGKRAVVNNIVTPDTKDAYIRILDTDQFLFYPKDQMKILERPEAVKPKRE